MKVSAHAIQHNFPYFSLVFLKHEFGFEDNYVPIIVNSNKAHIPFASMEYNQINNKDLFFEISFPPILLDEIAQLETTELLKIFCEIVSNL